MLLEKGINVMEKAYKLICNNDEQCFIILRDFCINETGDNINGENDSLTEICIPFDNMEISGQELYKLLFLEFEIGDKIILNVDEEFSEDSKYRKLFEILSDLINKAQESINSALINHEKNDSNDKLLNEENNASDVCESGEQNLSKELQDIDF